LGKIPLLMVFSFIVWITIFWDIIIGDVHLIGDASVYYQHFKFFIDSLSQGTYPMWDPFQNWGVPNELYLRRIGSFNPLFILIGLLNKIGFSFTFSYIIFLSFYYFLGMVGFYLLAKRMTGESTTSFIAFLLLLFSSTSIKIMDSYIILTMVPLIWYFYFLISIFILLPSIESSKKSISLRLHFLGMTFSTMILSTTYLPFYFITIFWLFLMCFGIVYFTSLRDCGVYVWKYILQNKIFTSLCLLLVITSLVPGLIFFVEGRGGELVLPSRHYEASSTNMLEVDFDQTTLGGVVVPIVAKDIISSFSHLNLGQIFIPLYCFIIFILGIIFKIHRRIMLLMLLGFVTILLAQTDAFGLNRILFQNIFYFKYFRNWEHFIWFALLPIFILLSTEQLNLFLRSIAKEKNKKSMLWWTLLVHIVLFIFVMIKVGWFWYISLTIMVSFIIFNLLILGLVKKASLTFLGLSMLCVFIQPLNLFVPLIKDLTHGEIYDFTREQKSDEYLYVRDGLKKRLDHDADFRDEYNLKNIPHLYFNTKSVVELVSHVDYDILEEYARFKFILVDSLRNFENEDSEYLSLEKAFLRNLNIAYVSRGESNVSYNIEKLENIKADVIVEGSDRLKIIHFDANSMRLKLKINKPQFLIYNDAYHKDWKSYINGVETRILKTNGAFKGVWVPEGENNVEFRFGGNWRLRLNVFILFIFYVTFGYLISLWMKCYCIKKTEENVIYE